MYINILIGILLYLAIVIFILWASDTVNSYLFPNLALEEDYCAELDADNMCSIMLAIIATAIVVIFIWWLIVIVDTCEQYSKYHRRKWLL